MNAQPPEVRGANCASTLEIARPHAKHCFGQGRVLRHTVQELGFQLFRAEAMSFELHAAEGVLLRTQTV
jgi:hypothetical protein